MLKKILLIDDDEYLSKLIAKNLINILGVECKYITDPSEAITAFTFFKPEVVLLDINFNNSRMQGYDICKQIKERDKNTIVLIVSGESTNESINLANQAGANDFLTKPYDVKTLICKVKSYLDILRC